MRVLLALVLLLFWLLLSYGAIPQWWQRSLTRVQRVAWGLVLILLPILGAILWILYQPAAVVTRPEPTLGPEEASPSPDVSPHPPDPS